MRKLTREMAKEITAVGMEDKQSVEVIGYLIWYSIGMKQIERSLLAEHVAASEIDPSLMPNEIRVIDAFRRSTKAIECKQQPIDRKGSERILVRETVTTAERVIRNIVREVIDPKEEEKLLYKTQEAIVTLEREDFYFLDTQIINPEVEPLVERIKELFVTFQTTHDDKAVRHMCIETIKRMSPVMVKTSGGVYFVPVKFEDQLRSFTTFVNLLELSSAYMIPLIKTGDTMDLVRKATVSQLNTAMENLKTAYDNRENLTPADITSVVNETQLSFGIIDDYQDLLNSDLRDITSSLRDMQRMLKAVASLKKDRRSKNENVRQLSLFD